MEGYIAFFTVILVFLFMYIVYYDDYKDFFKF